MTLMLLHRLSALAIKASINDHNPDNTGTPITRKRSASSRTIDRQQFWPAEGSARRCSAGKHAVDTGCREGRRHCRAGATFRGRPVIADGDVYTWSEHMVTFAAVLLGIPVSDVSVDLNAILLYQRHYCGSLGATAPETDFPLFLEWVREDKFPLEKLVTNRYSLDQIEEARVALEEGQILGRAIIGI